MSKSPRWTHAKSGHRLDAELMSKGPQRQMDSHSARETADWGRSSADCCSAVPPT
jgi:hypothetical protein